MWLAAACTCPVHVQKQAVFLGCQEEIKATEQKRREGSLEWKTPSIFSFKSSRNFTACSSQLRRLTLKIVHKNRWVHGLRLTHRLSFKRKCHGWACVLKHGSISHVRSNFVSHLSVPAFIYYTTKIIVISVTSNRKRPQHS